MKKIFAEPAQVRTHTPVQKKDAFFTDRPEKPFFTATNPVVQSQKSHADKAASNTTDSGLPQNLKSGVENLSGMAMDDVKVHYNSDKPEKVQALAYAQGTDIHLGPGQEQHLPHEAWHVVQQKQGRVKPTMQMMGGVSVNDDTELEKEADVMGGKAMQMRSADAAANQTILQNPWVIQRQQTEVCLSTASGTYTLNGVAGNFNFAQSSKGSDVIAKTDSHPKGKVNYEAIAEKYLRKMKIIPKDATGVQFTTCETYGIKK